MYKICITGFLFLILSVNCFAQIKQVKDSVLLDSTDAEKVLATSLDSLLQANAPSSYFQVGFGVGNQISTSHNLALNAKQVTPPFVLTPTVGYFNKSGFNIVANDYMLSENNTFGVNQYSITPGFETQPNTPFDFSVSYTRYIINNQFSTYSSPIQNDFYTSLVYKKPWLQGGVAIGYSSGQAKAVESLDTTIKISNTNKAIKLIDTTTTSLSLFSVVLSIQHNFGWKSALVKDDSISFIPQLMYNLGSTTGSVDNNDNLNNVLKALSLTKATITSIRNTLTKKVKKLTKFQQSSFGDQSAGIELQGSYTIGNFEIAPDIYFDYYLPQTTANRFTKIYVVNFSYSF